MRDSSVSSDLSEKLKPNLTSLNISINRFISAIQATDIYQLCRHFTHPRHCLSPTIHEVTLNWYRGFYPSSTV